MGNANRAQILHGGPQHARGNLLIPFETNPSDLNLRTLLDHKRNAYRRGRDLPHLATHNGKLPAMFGQELFNGDFGLLNLGGIILALDREPDFTFLESVEHVTGRDRVQARVVDLPDGRALFQINVENPSLGRLLALNADVFEISGVPQRIEIPLYGGWVVNVPRFCEDPRFDGVGGDAAVAVDPNIHDEVFLGQEGRTQKQQDQNQPWQCPAADYLPGPPTRMTRGTYPDWVDSDGARGPVRESRGKPTLRYCRASLLATKNCNYLRILGVWKTVIIRYCARERPRHPSRQALCGLAFAAPALAPKPSTPNKTE